MKKRFVTILALGISILGISAISCKFLYSIPILNITPEATATATLSPLEARSGVWRGTTDFGSFTFEVSPDGKTIVDLTLHYKSGEKVILEGDITLSGSSIPISEKNSFELNAPDFVFTAKFSKDGTSASGRWEMSSPIEASDNWKIKDHKPDFAHLTPASEQAISTSQADQKEAEIQATSVESIPSATSQPSVTQEPDFLVYPPTGTEYAVRETFDDNKNHWKAYYPGRVTSVRDGHIRVVSYEPGYVSVASCDGCGEFWDNFYLQADLALSKFSNVSYGVTFCVSENNNYYVYLVNYNSFKYSLFKLVDDEWNTLIDATYSDQIRAHPNTNTLSVYFDQGYMELFVNGFMVDSYTDPDPFSGGGIGLIVDDAGAELYGDNVFAYQR